MVTRDVATKSIERRYHTRGMGSGLTPETSINADLRWTLATLTTLEIGFIVASATLLVFGFPTLIRHLGLQMSESTEEKLVASIVAIYCCACSAFLLIY